jgi:hypothetical protein
MRRNFLRSGVFSGLILILAACAGVQPNVDSKGQAKPVSASSFKLTEVDVEWRDNPSFRYTVQVAGYGSAVTVNDAAKETARVYMQALTGQFRQHIKPELARELGAKSILTGKKQTILATPVQGLHTGAETNIVVRTQIIDQASGQIWTHDTLVSSGILFAGPNHNPPTVEFVKSYVKGLLPILQQAGLIAL